MRDARVEEVEHVSDSDSEEREEDQSQARLTVSIYPAHQGPTYLILPTKQERDNWLYHLTVVSGGGTNSGTQYEQLVQKLMETDGDPSTYPYSLAAISPRNFSIFFYVAFADCVMWRHPTLLHTKEQITSPLTSLHSELLQCEAIKLFKVNQTFGNLLKLSNQRFNTFCRTFSELSTVYVGRMESAGNRLSRGAGTKCTATKCGYARATGRAHLYIDQTD